MTRVYYKEAVGALVVFDVTRSSTFDGVSKWKADLDDKIMLADGSKIPAVLLANKVDLGKSTFVGNSEMEDFCHKKNFIGWFETSAKDNTNIDNACRFLVSKILENDIKQQQHQMEIDKGRATKGIVRLSDNQEIRSNSGCCSN
jgi:Ras-related protein Rab-32